MIKEYNCFPLILNALGAVPLLKSINRIRIKYGELNTLAFNILTALEMLFSQYYYYWLQYPMLNMKKYIISCLQIALASSSSNDDDLKCKWNITKSILCSGWIVKQNYCTMKVLLSLSIYCCRCLRLTNI